MRIDAHHHVWDLSVRDQPWTTTLPTLHRSFAIEDLLPELSRHDIDGSVVVQTVSGPEETPELLALTVEHPTILGVVGWVDLAEADVAGRLAALRTLPGGNRLVGVRVAVLTDADTKWLRSGDVGRGLSAVAEAGLACDLLVAPEHLGVIRTVVDSVTSMRWVLDHAGNPDIAREVLEPWRADLRAVAEHPGVACKLSGLITRDRPDWSFQRVARYANHALDTFGPDRVMWGSDWPVCTLHATYAETLSFAEQVTAHLEADEREAVWGRTAQQWYRWAA